LKILFSCISIGHDALPCPAAAPRWCRPPSVANPWKRRTLLIADVHPCYQNSRMHGWQVLCANASVAANRRTMCDLQQRYGRKKAHVRIETWANPYL